MRIQLTTALFFKTLLCLILGFFCLNTLALAQNKASKPGKVAQYISDYVSGWILQKNTYYTYDGTGLVTEILETYPSNQSMSREKITYDNYGNEILFDRSSWYNGNKTD